MPFAGVGGPAGGVSARPRLDVDDRQRHHVRIHLLSIFCGATPFTVDICAVRGHSINRNAVGTTLVPQHVPQETGLLHSERATGQDRCARQ